MPKSYEKMRDKFIANGMTARAAKTKAARIYNARRGPGTPPVTKSHTKAKKTAMRRAMLLPIMWILFVACYALTAYGQEFSFDAVYQRDSKIVQTLDLEAIKGVTYRAHWVVRSDDGGEDPDVRVHQDESGVSIWAPIGKYETLVMLAIITEENTDDNGSIMIIDWIDLHANWEVSGGINPPDPPDPDDPVNPQTGFDEVPQMVADLVRPVRDTDKAENCASLAEVYRKHGQLAKDGAYKDADELADACNAEYQYMIGINAFLRYRPAMTLVRKEISKMMKDDRLEEMADWGNLWIAIGEGFEIAAKEDSDDSIPGASS